MIFISFISNCIGIFCCSYYESIYLKKKKNGPLKEHKGPSSVD